MAISESLTCLFWNVHRDDRRELVAALAAEKQVDVVVLAEHGASPESTLKVLQGQVAPSFVAPRAVTPRIQLFSRKPELDLQEVYADASGRVSIRELRVFGNEFLFAAVHLESKLHTDPVEQALQAQILADQIRRLEERHQHRRTILVGDLNMNPFEDGVVSASGLHGTMTKATANDGGRVVQGVEYPFFYKGVVSPVRL